jgi:hypothetical protein
MNSTAEQKNGQSVVDLHRILQNANVLIDRKCTTALKIGDCNAGGLSES